MTGNTNQTEEQDRLKAIFSRLPDEPLPETWLPAMMQRIHAEALQSQKRSERWMIVAMIAASLMMVGLAVAAFIYMDISPIRFDFEIQWIKIPKDYIFIGLSILFLLLADSLFRRNYSKKHPESV
ncbi:MAG: hypothetical protein LBD27_03610 [Tannerella sp.]|jgi:hypothetical protein|nr:hypothetical protein [Tannerella sp.]